MAKQPLKPKRRVRPARGGLRSDNSLPFTKKNYVLFGVGLLVILLGFFFLERNSITLAPILLVAGYCVLIPWAIVAK